MAYRLNQHAPFHLPEALAGSDHQPPLPSPDYYSYLIQTPDGSNVAGAAGSTPGPHQQQQQQQASGSGGDRLGANGWTPDGRGGWDPSMFRPPLSGAGNPQVRCQSPCRGQEQSSALPIGCLKGRWAGRPEGRAACLPEEVKSKPPEDARADHPFRPSCARSTLVAPQLPSFMRAPSLGDISRSSQAADTHRAVDEWNLASYHAGAAGVRFDAGDGVNDWGWGCVPALRVHLAVSRSRC